MSLNQVEDDQFDRLVGAMPSKQVGGQPQPVQEEDILQRVEIPFMAQGIMTQDKDQQILEKVIPSKNENRALREFMDSTLPLMPGHPQILVPFGRKFHESLMPQPQPEPFKPPEPQKKVSKKDPKSSKIIGEN